MIEYLCTDITQWRTLGYQILFMIEFNEKVTSDTVTELFASVGLPEAITHPHLATGLVPTYQRGSQPIDGIYNTRTINVSAGAYLQFGIIRSDHRLLWLKNRV